MMVCATVMCLISTQKSRMLINAGRIIYSFRSVTREIGNNTPQMQIEYFIIGV